MIRDFNDLRFFAAVVQHRGFSAGARALRLPKSRGSRRVAVLEERLGVRLLDRTTRGVNLTEVGQQVFDHARAAVIEAEAAEEAALRMQSEPRGLVRMSCPLGLQAAIAAVAIRVRERLDTDAELQMKRIGVSKRILVASPMLLAGMSEPSTPDELFRFPTLHQDPKGPSVWRLATERGDADTVAIEPALLRRGASIILIASACQGIGIALLPARNCKEALASGALVRVLPDWTGVRRDTASRLCVAQRNAPRGARRHRFRRDRVEIVCCPIGSAPVPFTR